MTSSNEILAPDPAQRESESSGTGASELPKLSWARALGGGELESAAQALIARERASGTEQGKTAQRSRTAIITVG